MRVVVNVTPYPQSLTLNGEVFILTGRHSLELSQTDFVTDYEDNHIVLLNKL